MLGKTWRYLWKKITGCRNFQIKFMLLLLTAAFLALLPLNLSRVRDTQKEAVRADAAACAETMDKYLSSAAVWSPFSSDHSQPESITSVAYPATFVLLQDGKILYTEGADPLSHRLVESVCRDISAKNAFPDTVYPCQASYLPLCYFCRMPSRTGGLSYCYYEPALSGLPLLRQLLLHPLGFLLLFLAAMILSALILLLSSGRPAQNRVIEITSPCENSDTFGSRPRFSGIIIDYRNVAGGFVSPEILELFDQIVQENLSVNKILFQHSSKIYSDCLQYHINYSNYNLRVLCDSLKMNLYNAAPDYTVNIFYSEAVSTRQEMEKDLLYLNRRLRYSQLLGYGHRIPISTIRTLEASTEKLDDNVARIIQNHLRTRAYEDLYQYLNRHRDICTHLHARNIKYSFSEVYRFAEEAFSAVKLFFQENAFSHPMVHTSCSTVLRAAPGFDSFCDYLTAAIRTYQLENQHVLTSRNEQIMNSIYMYIEQDLAGANLGAIARKLDMTDSHLSRVFKKNTGTNFSEYLSERKLEEAARLLIQSEKVKVADIADMLGYGNPTYFLSRFKAKYGISPTAYRRTHLNNS